MKIAISAEMPDLAAQVAQRFGNSPYLIIVDSETMEIEALPKPQFAYLIHMADTERGNGDGELQLGEFVKHEFQIVGRLRPVRVPSHLDRLPRLQVAVDLLLLLGQVDAEAVVDQLDVVTEYCGWHRRSSRG